MTRAWTREVALMFASRSHDRLLLCFVRDPDGYRIELIERSPT